MARTVLADHGVIHNEAEVSMSKPTPITIHMKATSDLNAAGWYARLLGLDSEYRAYSRDESFGRVSHVVKHSGATLVLLQGAKTVCKTVVETLTPEVAKVIRDLLAVGALCDLSCLAKAALDRVAPAVSPKLYEFGCAPAARADGYGIFDRITHGTTEAVVADYAGQDVAIIAGASVFGSPGSYEFGVFRRSA